MSFIEFYKPSVLPDRSTIFDIHQQFINKFYEEFNGNRKFFNVSQSSYPKMDIVEDKEKLYVRCAVPGILREDLEIETNKEERTLTIKGQESSEYSLPDNMFHPHIRELKHSSFSRTIRLHEFVDIDKCEANLKDGLLCLTFDLIKQEEVLPESFIKKITVK